MKRNILYSLLLLLCFFSNSGWAQITIGSDKAPSPFAILDMNTSKDKRGLRVPQLTGAQMTQLTTNLNAQSDADDQKVLGLMVYSLADNSQMIWKGKALGWFKLAELGNNLPIITLQPTGNTFIDGNPIPPLKVDATGENLSYRWYKNGEFVAFGKELNIGIANINTAGIYWAEVTDNGNLTVRSDVAQIKVGAQTLTLVPVNGIDKIHQDGELKAYVVSTSSPIKWKVSVFSDPAGIITNIAPLKGNTGDQIQILAPKNFTRSERKATLFFESDEPGKNLTAYVDVIQEKGDAYFKIIPSTTTYNSDTYTIDTNTEWEIESFNLRTSLDNITSFASTPIDITYNKTGNKIQFIPSLNINTSSLLTTGAIADVKIRITTPGVPQLKNPITYAVKPHRTDIEHTTSYGGYYIYPYPDGNKLIFRDSFDPEAVPRIAAEMSCTGLESPNWKLMSREDIHTLKNTGAISIPDPAPLPITGLTKEYGLWTSTYSHSASGIDAYVYLEYRNIFIYPNLLREYVDNQFSSNLNTQMKKGYHCSIPSTKYTNDQKAVKLIPGNKTFGSISLGNTTGQTHVIPYNNIKRGSIEKIYWSVNNANLKFIHNPTANTITVETTKNKDFLEPAEKSILIIIAKAHNGTSFDLQILEFVQAAGSSAPASEYPKITLNPSSTNVNLPASEGIEYEVTANVTNGYLSDVKFTNNDANLELIGPDASGKVKIRTKEADLSLYKNSTLEFSAKSIKYPSLSVTKSTISFRQPPGPKITFNGGNDLILKGWANHGMWGNMQITNGTFVTASWVNNDANLKIGSMPTAGALGGNIGIITQDNRALNEPEKSSVLRIVVQSHDGSVTVQKDFIIKQESPILRLKNFNPANILSSGKNTYTDILEHNGTITSISRVVGGFGLTRTTISPKEEEVKLLFSSESYNDTDNTSDETIQVNWKYDSWQAGYTSFTETYTFKRYPKPFAEIIDTMAPNTILNILGFKKKFQIKLRQGTVITNVENGGSSNIGKYTVSQPDVENKIEVECTEEYLQQTWSAGNLTVALRTNNLENNYPNSKVYAIPIAPIPGFNYFSTHLSNIEDDPNNPREMFARHPYGDFQKYEIYGTNPEAFKITATPGPGANETSFKVASNKIAEPGEGPKKAKVRFFTKGITGYESVIRTKELNADISPSSKYPHFNLKIKDLDKGTNIYVHTDDIDQYVEDFGLQSITNDIDNFEVSIEVIHGTIESTYTTIPSSDAFMTITKYVDAPNKWRIVFNRIKDYNMGDPLAKYDFAFGIRGENNYFKGIGGSAKLQPELPPEVQVYTHWNGNEYYMMDAPLGYTYGEVMKFDSTEDINPLFSGCPAGTKPFKEYNDHNWGDINFADAPFGLWDLKSQNLLDITKTYYILGQHQYFTPSIYQYFDVSANRNKYHASNLDEYGYTTATSAPLPDTVKRAIKCVYSK